MLYVICYMLLVMFLKNLAWSVAECGSGFGVEPHVISYLFLSYLLFIFYFELPR